MTSREQIFTALWALNENVEFSLGDDAEGNQIITKFLTRERKLRLFSDVSSDQKPYISQVEHAEQYTKIRNQPYRRVFDVQWFVYHDNNTIPTIVNNNILDAIENALKPKPTDVGFFENRNTLHGLVWDCYIEGEVFKDPGDIDNQAMMVIPIKLLVP